MGASQSSGASSVSQVKFNPVPKQQETDPNKTQGKVLETPIFMDEDDGPKNSSNFPTPTGHEYDLMDKIAAELPSHIDEQSKQQVDDYRQACNGGKGNMVACFATAEFVSLFERKHKDAFDLYKNICYRPKKDTSPNGVLVDGTKAYPAGCFNLAQMLMTGKGGVPFDRTEGYAVFDRACRGGHGGACHMQAKMLLSDPGQLGKGVPYNPRKAAKLLEGVCEEGDSYSCFLLATMMLRGGNVTPDADNVSPQEASGLTAIQRRQHEANRKKAEDDARVALPRNPKRAEELLQQACLVSGHAPSCYNLAVMYTQGDDGVPKDEEKAKEFQKKTEEKVEQFGGFGM
jgi:TPR repeat protein